MHQCHGAARNLKLQKGGGAYFCARPAFAVNAGFCYFLRTLYLSENDSIYKNCDTTGKTAFSCETEAAAFVNPDSQLFPALWVCWTLSGMANWYFLLTQNVLSQCRQQKPWTAATQLTGALCINVWGDEQCGFLKTRCAIHQYSLIIKYCSKLIKNPALLMRLC